MCGVQLVLVCYSLIQYDQMESALFSPRPHFPIPLTEETEVQLSVAQQRALLLGQLLTSWRRAKGLSRPETLSELKKQGLALSYSHLQKMEKGERSLASAAIEIREGLRKLYGIPRKEWYIKTQLYTPDPPIMNQEAHLITSNINEGRRRIPVIDLLSAGPGGGGGTVVSHIDLPPEFVGPHAAYRITGDSMIPEIKDGGTVVIRCQEYSSPGNIIVCYTPDDGMLCKLLDKVEDGYCVLASLNTMYKPIWTPEIHIYGVMVEVRNPRRVINGNH